MTPLPAQVALHSAHDHEDLEALPLLSGLPEEATQAEPGFRQAPDAAISSASLDSTSLDSTSLDSTSLDTLVGELDAPDSAPFPLTPTASRDGFTVATELGLEAELPGDIQEQLTRLPDPRPFDESSIAPSLLERQPRLQSPLSLAERLQSMHAAQQAKDYAGLLQRFLEACAAFPQQGAPYALLAKALLEWNAALEARGVLLRGLRCDPLCQPLYALLVQVELELGHPGDARRLLEFEDSHFELDVQGLTRHARLALTMGDLRRAQLLLERAGARLTPGSRQLEPLLRSLSKLRRALALAAHQVMQETLATRFVGPLQAIESFLELCSLEDDLIRRQYYAELVRLQVHSLQDALASPRLALG